MNKNNGRKLALDCPPRSQRNQKCPDGHRKPSALGTSRMLVLLSYELWNALTVNLSTNHCPFLFSRGVVITNGNRGNAGRMKKTKSLHPLGSSPLRVQSLSSCGHGSSSSLTHALLFYRISQEKNYSYTMTTSRRLEDCKCICKMKQD